LDDVIDDYFVTSKQYQINWLEAEKVFRFEVVVNYNKNGITLTDSVIISINANPRDVKTIAEVIHSAPNATYCLRGTVVLVGDLNESWYYLKDDTGIIMVDVAGTYHGLSRFNVGDELILYGTYSNQDPSFPRISSTYDAVVRSSNNLVFVTPLEMSIDDIWNLDYLDPNIYGQYLAVSGTIQKRGDYYDPYYVLVKGDKEIRFKTVYNPTINPVGVLYQNIGNSLTVAGYLHSFEFDEETCTWIMTFDGTCHLNV
jgi:hypothetical protein